MKLADLIVQPVPSAPPVPDAQTAPEAPAPEPAPQTAQDIRSQAAETEYQAWKKDADKRTAALMLALPNVDETSEVAYGGTHEAWDRDQAARGIVRYSGEGLTPEDYDPVIDDYGSMIQAGFTHKEVREYLGPRLAACGFTDRQIHEYFTQNADPGFTRAAKYGWQGSWLGMKTSGKLPDELQPEEAAAMGMGSRLVSQLGTLGGDAIPFAIGGALGVLGGPAAPVTIPAGAFGLAEGWKAAARGEIEGKKLTLDKEGAKFAKELTGETVKGMAIGAATGGAGSLAAGTAAKAGLGVVGQTAAKLGAETLAMPTASAAMEGRLPSSQEVFDAAVLISFLHIGTAGVTKSWAKAISSIRDVAPKLDGIAVKLGKQPEEVLNAAKEDPTIQQDLLSINKDIPEALKPQEEQAAKTTDEQTSKTQPQEASHGEEGQRQGQGRQGLLNQEPGEAKPDAVDTASIQARRNELTAPYRAQLVAAGYSQEVADAHGQILGASAERLAPIFGMTSEEYLQSNLAGFREVTPEEFAREQVTGDRGQDTGDKTLSDAGNIPADLDQKLAILERQMREGEVGQRFQRNPEDDQSWDGVKSTNPEWLKEGLLFKAGKAGVRRVIEKVRAGKKLTDLQKRQWEEIQKAAESEWGRDHEALQGQGYDKAQAAGIDLHEPRKIAVGDLRPGDQVVIEEKGVPDLVTHKGFDEDGNAILKDGVTIHADPFEVLTSIGEKQAEDRTKMLYQQGAKRQKFDASSTVIVTGKEMGEIPKFKKFKEIKEFVFNWIGKKTDFFRNDYSNTDTGWENIALTPKGIDNTLQHSARREKIQTIPAIPELIKNGIHLESPTAHDTTQKNMTSHMFAAKVDIDGKPMVVGFVIKEDPATGRRFYDHELTEMQSLDDPKAGVTSKKELTDDADRQGDVMNIVRKHLGVKPDVTFPQEGVTSPRGAIDFSKPQAVISLFTGEHNASTIIHETAGHFLFDQLGKAVKLETAPEWTKSAWETLKSSYGFDETSDAATMRGAHERFAKDAEAYIREGKAPTPELQSAFAKFSEWLRDIYRSVKDLLGDNQLSPEVREVFDNLLSREEERSGGTEKGLETDSKGTEKGQSGVLADTYAEPRQTGHAVPIDPNKPVLPEGPLSHKDATPISSVIDALGKAFNVPIRIGKFRLRAHGVYKSEAEVIRLKVANSIKTAVHEVGHHLQNLLFGEISWKPLTPFRGELEPIATKPRAGQSSLPEGFAEFVAKYVVNPEEARQVAPRFFVHFEKLLDKQAPELKRALLEAREGVKKWAEQPAALEVLSHINIDGGQGDGILSRLSSRDTWDRVYTNFVDRLFPLKRAVDMLTAGEELPADMNPYTLARTFAGAKGKAAHFIERAPFKFDTWKNVGKPLAATLRAVENLDEFRAYLVSRRGLELEGRGVNSGIRPEAMRATVEQFRDKYEHRAVELDEYQEHLTNYLVDAGLVSEDAAAAMREMNKSYVPFYRLMEDEKGGVGGARGLQGRNPIKRIKGSGRDIIDPLESIIKNTYAYIEAAEKNAIGKAFTDLAEKQGAGWLVEKLPQPMEAVRISREELGRTFLKEIEGIDPRLRDNIASMLSEGETGEMATFWQNARNIDKKNQIAVYREGKREVFQVAPEIAEVFHDLKAETVPLLIKLLAIPSRLLRAGATLTPDFMARNLLRDAIDAGVISRSGFIPGLDTARGLKHAVTHDETYWNWVKAGGEQASLVSMDRTTLQKTLNDITTTGYAGRVWNLVRNPVELLRLTSELSEKTTRLGEFGKAAQQHGSDKAGLIQAGYESRDIMDFSRRGRLMASFNTVTAFFNASLQGLDRMGRGVIEDPKRFLVKAALYIAIPSVINAIRNHDDKDVAEINRAQRDMFWVVPVGEGQNKTILRIPKPFENGVLFGSTLERATEFLLDAYSKKYDGDLNKARQEAFRGLGKSAFDIAMPNMIPTFAVPFIEQFANRSTVFNRPIIPQNRAGFLPEYQYATYTTELMKSLSRAVGGLSAVGEMDTFRPAMAENYLRAWTGGLGMYALQALDAAGRNAGLLPNPVKPADTLADFPFVRAFIVRHPSMGAESIQRFYDSYDEASKYLKTINGLKTDISGYQDVSNLIPYSVYQAMEGPHKMIGEITKVIDIINKDPSGTPDEKRQQIDSLYFQAIQVAKLGNHTFEALQKDIEQLKERATKEAAR